MSRIKEKVVIPVYSELGHSEYPHTVNDLLCTGHSTIGTNGKKCGFSERAYC